jgi:hypothetical protein
MEVSKEGSLKRIVVQERIVLQQETETQTFGRPSLEIEPKLPQTSRSEVPPLLENQSLALISEKTRTPSAVIRKRSESASQHDKPLSCT